MCNSREDYGRIVFTPQKVYLATGLVNKDNPPDEVPYRQYVYVPESTEQIEIDGVVFVPISVGQWVYRATVYKDNAYVEIAKCLWLGYYSHPDVQWHAICTVHFSPYNSWLAGMKAFVKEQWEKANRAGKWHALTEPQEEEGYRITQLVCTPGRYFSIAVEKDQARVFVNFEGEKWLLGEELLMLKPWCEILKSISQEKAQRSSSRKESHGSQGGTGRMHTT